MITVNPDMLTVLQFNVFVKTCYKRFYSNEMQVSTTAMAPARDVSFLFVKMYS